MTTAVMLFNLSFDSHQPGGAMCLCRYTVWASRILRGLQRVEPIEVPINRLRERPHQRSVRQNRTALLPTSLWRIFGALHGRRLYFSSEHADYRRVYAVKKCHEQQESCNADKDAAPHKT